MAIARISAEHDRVASSSRRRDAGTDRGARTSAALSLQRAAGNRATARILARWTNHPDATKKGVTVPDVVAADYLRFNPPANE